MPLVARLEQYALSEVIAGDVGNRSTGGGAFPVGVEDKRVVGAVEDASGLGGSAVLGGETVGVVVAGEKGVFDGVERLGSSGSVVDAPETVSSGVQRERADTGVGVFGESVCNPVAARLVVESENEFAHTHRKQRFDKTRRDDAVQP